MGRVLKVLFLVLILAAVVVGVYAAARGRGAAADRFTLVAVERGDITEKAVAVGEVEPRLTYHVKSKISGIVRRTAVEVGDAVAPGDPLIEILPDPTPVELVEAERELEAAQSAYARAEAEWRRSQALAEQGIVADNELDARRESFELARVEAARCEDNLQLIRDGRVAGRGRQLESVIRAPAAGIVLRRLVNPGDPVVPLTSFQEGTELAAIADMSDLIFRGTVDEIDVGQLYVGLPARLKVGALPEATVTGLLSRIAPQAIEREGAKLFEVEIELDPAAGVELRAGYSANADLVIREKTATLILPERLVLFEDGGRRTFVELPGEGPDAEPVRREIVTGLSDGLSIEVLEGLEEGEQVIQRPPRDILG